MASFDKAGTMWKRQDVIPIFIPGKEVNTLYILFASGRLLKLRWMSTLFSAYFNTYILKVNYEMTTLLAKTI